MFNIHFVQVLSFSVMNDYWKYECVVSVMNCVLCKSNEV